MRRRIVMTRTQQREPAGKAVDQNGLKWMGKDVRLQYGKGSAEEGTDGIVRS